MFFNFLSRWSEDPKWNLKPKKFSADNPNNYGGKVLLPQSVLSNLIDMQIYPPYVFNISRTDNTMNTHCGVLEFTADETEVVVPVWIYEQLDMLNTNEIMLKYTTLPLGSYLKLKPHLPIFLEIDNPKLELEGVLKNYPTLSLHDEIECKFDEHGIIKFTVVSIKPSSNNGIYIVDVDLMVDFSEPVGYKEKMEDEKTVNKYLEVVMNRGNVKVLRMKKLGIAFSPL